MMPSSVQNRNRPSCGTTRTSLSAEKKIVVGHRLRDQIDVAGHADLGVHVARRGHRSHAGDPGEGLT
jgi:hypothetical protein